MISQWKQKTQETTLTTTTTTMLAATEWERSGLLKSEQSFNEMHVLAYVLLAKKNAQQKTKGKQRTMATNVCRLPQLRRALMCLMWWAHLDSAAYCIIASNQQNSVIYTQRTLSSFLLSKMEKASGQSDRAIEQWNEKQKEREILRESWRKRVQRKKCSTMRANSNNCKMRNRREWKKSIVQSCSQASVDHRVRCCAAAKIENLGDLSASARRQWGR